MQIISSYGVELRKQNIPIRQTLEIYRSAVSYLIGIYVQVWEELAEMGCICFENEAMGIYFIVDPDGYWLEILP